jgi:WD40 repeat protein
MQRTQLILKNKSPVFCIAHSPTHKLLAVGQMGDNVENASLSLWDYEKGKQVDIIEKAPFQNINSVCFDYSEKYLVYTANDKLIRYDISNHKKLAFPDTIKNISKIVSSETPAMIVSGKTTCVLSVDSMETTWRLPEYTGGVNIAGAETSGFPEEWRMKISEKKLDYTTGQAIVEIFGNGETVIIGGHNQSRIQLLNTRSNEIIKEIPDGPLLGNCMSLGCQESILAVSSRIPDANFLWELKSGKRILPDIFNVRFGGYPSVCVHPTKKFIATGSLVGYVSLQNLDDGKFFYSEKLHTNKVNQVVLSNEGIIFSGSDDGEVKIIHTGV